MKKSTAIKSAGTLAIVALLIAGPAQAGMGSCLFGTVAPTTMSNCGGEQGNNQAANNSACPTQSGNGKTSCPTGDQVIGHMVGSVAAGGVRIAASVMRAVAGEAGRQLASGPGM